ncbi:MAG: pyruvate carboxylase subunit B [Opitutaceae bacterium]|jgi:oxaloacetate decarboxylase alpha subunit/pyruvate carboxylase subunit B
MKPIIFNNTVLRDGHQSLAATRMTTAQMLPVAGLLDAQGFGALETWGGATIDSCLRFLNENPFDRLDKLKAAAPKTPHMMLLRGQNIVQYTSFPDDVVEAFVNCSAKHGMDIFRIFDALNDARNLRTAIRTVKAAGKHAQGAICYTTSPVHTPEKLAALADELVAMECDSICIKDMAGLLSPRITYDLVKAIKSRHSLPVIVHSHDTAGLALASYMAAIEAGADAIDTSITPFANGTGQPDTVRMQAALEGNPRAPHYDPKALFELRKYFEGVAGELTKFMSSANERVDSDALCYQVPGGMLSNFRTQLVDMKMSDRFNDVMAEVPVVREALGWIPLVTPTSQIVGTQAMLNVKFGRWKNLAQSTIDIALGKFGRPPGPLNPELLALARKQSGQEPVLGRPADLLAPRMPKLREELAAKGLPVSDENAVLFAMFPRETEAFYHPKPAAAAAATPAPAAPVAPAPVAPAATTTPAVGRISRYALTVGQRRYETSVEVLN